MAFSDASHSSKTKEISRERHAIFLVDVADNANLIKDGWARVCKSTLMQRLLDAADTAYFRKLLIEDMLGTKEKIPIICYTDNESLVQCNDLL